MRVRYSGSSLLRVFCFIAVIAGVVSLAVAFPAAGPDEIYAVAAANLSPVVDPEGIRRGLAQLPLVTIEPREGRRPVPVSDIAGKSYDDLLFYDNPSRNSDASDPDEVFNRLPPGRLVRNDEWVLKQAYILGQRFGAISTVRVDGMPFREALKVTVNTVPQNAQSFQIMPGSLTGRVDFQPGDAMLIVVYMRTLNTDREDGLGIIQFVVEDTDPPYKKSLQADAVAVVGGGWQKFYLPFVIQQGHTGIRIRVGYARQTVEIGGFQLINYGKSVKLADLPQLEGMDYYRRAVFSRYEQWRKDAWDRIGEIRKGEINVIVQDAAGNPVENAKVDISMTEHVFQWGTVISESIIRPAADQYRAAITSLFNSGVMGYQHKWNEYDANPSRARRSVDAAKALNLRYIRGHTLMWDRSFSGGWVFNTSIPREVYNLFTSNNRAGLDARIRNHILRITGDFAGELVDWDVVNEALENHAIRTKYGNGVLKDWFAWARQGDPSAKLYINETDIIGRSQRRLDRFKELLDYMDANKVDFDGIGIQGHFLNSMVHPALFYDELVEKLVPLV